MDSRGPYGLASEVAIMEAPTMPDPGDRWLTRETIDRVIESMSARDLVDAMDTYDPKSQSTQYAMAAFDSAAARDPFVRPAPASAHVRMADFAYLASAIGEAVNIESPPSDGQEG